MDRNPENGEIIMSPSEFGHCLTHGFGVLWGESTTRGIVEEFFREMEEFEGSITRIPDHRLSLNDVAIDSIRDSLFGDITNIEEAQRHLNRHSGGSEILGGDRARQLKAAKEVIWSWIHEIRELSE